MYFCRWQDLTQKQLILVPLNLGMLTSLRISPSCWGGITESFTIWIATCCGGGDQVLKTHPNGMRFSCYDEDGTLLATNEYFSVGGGFVVNEKTKGFYSVQ